MRNLCRIKVTYLARQKIKNMKRIIILEFTRVATS